ncbi:hypothetical protein THRCLA_21568 [Thraustotheca clavata]|uniref:Uncharacterized protein n=1 Tax=Thraustotheca clavata TaxID=74557 RepID=A0A1V9ZV90_9STRA|nr:hypothetical protein THRCLA_21568 [Thraustotheca clavata]
MSEQYNHQCVPADTSLYSSTPKANRSSLCTYKSGKCTNFRTLKQNGEQHSLCAYHRDKQNAHQRKSDRKARFRKAAIIRANEQHISFKNLSPPPPLPKFKCELASDHQFQVSNDHFGYPHVEYPSKEGLISPWAAMERLPSIYELLQSRTSSM